MGLPTTSASWVLGFIYWLHMLATVVWLGGMAAIVVLILPITSQVLELETQSVLLRKIRSRIQQLGWLSLIVLIATGMFQMSSHPNYSGFLAINNPWAVAIFLKHMAIGVMMIISGYISLWLNPALERSLIRVKTRKPESNDSVISLEKREIRLFQLNLAVSIIVLAFTAWARAS